MMSSQEPLVYQVGVNPMDQHEKFQTKYRSVTYKKYRRAKLHPNTEDTHICPECGAETITDLDRCEIYCTDCGLVVKASISYVGNKQIIYPFGILL